MSPPPPFLERRRVVLLDGESEAGSLTDHLTDLRAQFESRGFDVVVIDLKAPGSDAALIRQVESGLVRFCFGLSGFGAELSVTHAHGTANFWDYARTPYVGVMPDSPVFVPSRHRLSSEFVLFLYSDPVHLDVAASIGSPLTARALVSQAGFPPVDPPAPFSSRDIAVVYAKAGGDPEEIRKGWRALPATHRAFIEEIVAAACWRADVSIWHVALEIARAMGQPEHARGDALCHAVSQCELYVRRARASRALEELLSFPVHVSGGDWAHLDWSGARATLGPRVPLTELRALFGRSKVVLNAMPALRFSTHHRVMEGMLHGAAAASDANSWLDTVVTRSRYVAFDWVKGSVAHAVSAALADEAALAALAERGRTFALAHHEPGAQFDHMLRTIDGFLARADGAWG